MSAKHLILYSRSYCHLCDDMLLALRASFADAQVEVRDVDSDAAALQAYDELVPVLLGRHADGSLVQLCHYFLDAQRVAAYLHDN